MSPKVQRSHGWDIWICNHLSWVYSDITVLFHIKIPRSSLSGYQKSLDIWLKQMDCQDLVSLLSEELFRSIKYLRESQIAKLQKWNTFFSAESKRQLWSYPDPQLRQIWLTHFSNVLQNNNVLQTFTDIWWRWKSLLERSSSANYQKENTELLS